MNSRLSLPLLAAASLSVMFVVSACGGSGGSAPTPPPPTLQEAVAAANAVDSAATGEVAYTTVTAFISGSRTPPLSGPAADAANVRETFGKIFFADTAGPSGITYGNAIEAAEEILEHPIDEAAAIAAFNADLQAAPTNAATRQRNAVQFVAALEGGEATLDKGIRIASTLAFSTWLVDYAGPVASGLVRGPCKDQCAAKRDAEILAIDISTNARLAVIKALNEFSLMPVNSFGLAYLRQNILNMRNYSLGLAIDEYNGCVLTCHEQ
ncbi:MAG: hypothetical protein ACO1SV_08730 [Fimbriimonas sp.]